MKLLLLAALSLLGPITARADFEPDPARLLTDLPPHRTGPVPVVARVFILDIAKIDGADENFSASIYLNLKWKDDRLAFDAAKYGAARAIYSGAAVDDQLDAMWNPAIGIPNLKPGAQTSNKVLTILPDGEVEYEMEIQGEFGSPMSLRRFPFDHQTLHLFLESYLWTQTEVQLVDPRAPAMRGDNFGVRDWDVNIVTSTVAPSTYTSGDVYSRLTVKATVDRKPWFYIWGVIFPLVLVTMFALMCFFWDQETISERTAQALTCLLTVTAQSLAINGDLPKISYFTTIDYAFLLTYAVLFAVAVESIYVKFLYERNPAQADRLDFVCGWSVGLAYILGMAAVFCFV